MNPLKVALLLLVLSVGLANGSLIAELRVGRDYWNGLNKKEKNSCIMGFVVTHLSKNPEPYVSPSMIPDIRENIDWIYASTKYDRVPLYVAFLYGVRLIENPKRETVIKELADLQEGWKTQW